MIIGRGRLKEPRSRILSHGRRCKEQRSKSSQEIKAGKRENGGGRYSAALNHRVQESGYECSDDMYKWRSSLFDFAVQAALQVVVHHP